MKDLNAFNIAYSAMVILVIAGMIKLFTIWHGIDIAVAILTCLTTAASFAILYAILGKEATLAFLAESQEEGFAKSWYMTIIVCGGYLGGGMMWSFYTTIILSAAMIAFIKLYVEKRTVAH